MSMSENTSLHCHNVWNQWHFDCFCFFLHQLLNSGGFPSQSASNAESVPMSWWWRHEMEAFSALLALCAGNSLVTGEFPTQRPVTRSFDIFFDLRLNKQLNKQSWGWWFETLSRSLWRQFNDDVIITLTNSWQLFWYAIWFQKVRFIYIMPYGFVVHKSKELKSMFPGSCRVKLLKSWIDFLHAVLWWNLMIPYQNLIGNNSMLSTRLALVLLIYVEVLG